MAARLLLIEDDASIARFVDLALQELPEHDPAAPAVALVHVRSVAEARAAMCLLRPVALRSPGRAARAAR